MGIYYQFFLDEKEIVAKGFDLDIDEFDTLLLANNEIQFLDSVYKSPFNLSWVKQKLKIIGVKDVSLLSSSSFPLAFELIDVNDSTHSIILEISFEKDKVIRKISYFNGKGY